LALVTVEKMLVRLANQERPLMVGYDHLQSRWVFRIEGKEIAGSVLKEVVREAHREFHGT
jgi:hypothetical protein